MKRICLFTVLCHLALPLAAMPGGDPLVATVIVDKFEAGIDEGHTPQRLEADGWLGYDLNKLWLKTEIEREGSQTSAADLELLYSRAVAPFWDLQVGAKHDFSPGPDRDWLAIGFKGLAPYLFEVDASAYIGESGDSALSLEAEYEILFTQRLILSPSLTVALNSYNDALTGAGSGFSSAEFGLRLRYEIRREFAPYIGVNWHRAYGNTADFLRAEGEDNRETTVVIGIRAWF